MKVSRSRRKIVCGAAAVSAGFALNRFQLAAATEGSQRASITRPIPSTGERIPVIGLGTNQYSVRAPEEIARLQIVLETMLAQGGSVVDTARVYGRSEEVIGELVQKIDQRKRFFIVTKTPIFGQLRAPEVEIQASFDRLKVDTIDVMLIHNLHGLDVLIPAFIRAREKGRIRYVGMSTSEKHQYAPQMDAMRR